MFAVVLLPNFRLQAALRFREEMQARPVALMDGHDPKTGILEINGAAAAAGMTTGQTATQALARCPSLTILSRSPAQEQSVQAALLEIAGTLSPEIEATADGYCTVNLRASREKDWPALGARIVASLATLSLGAQAGIASNPDLAFIAARHARPVLVVQTPQAFLANLALHELNPAPDLLAVLSDWGIHNLAQLTSLPRGDIMDRLGPEAARLWERAAGKTERPLRLVRAAEEFAEAFDFEREVDTVEPLFFTLRRFLDQLAARLGNVHRVAGRMALTLTLANGSKHERAFTVPSPTACADVLFRILQTHLDDLRLDHAATGVRLLITPTLAERQQFQLFESPLRDPNRFGETLGRLAALVGAENVGTPQVLDTHRPDSFRLNPPRFHESTAPALPDGFAVGLPLRRWRPPLAAEVHVVRHRPDFIVSAKVRGVIRDALGPYRASGGWWEREQQGNWATEEWDVETEGGGLYRLARSGNEWRIEGSYNEPPVQNRPGPHAIVPMQAPGA
ncbi:MAG: DNA polymerase Y family protein [Chthoniobacteraceae bacterium]